MPTNLFYTVTVPCSIWIINRNKKQKGKTLFINANDMGTMVTKRLRELSGYDITKIAETYHNFQNGNSYENVKGFCYSADISEINSKENVLTPKRYVGIEDSNVDDISYDEKMNIITSNLYKLFDESKELETDLKDILNKIGF